MINKLRQLKAKRYAATIMIGLLLVFVLGLITILNPSIKNIKVKKILSKTSSLNASVLDGMSEGVTSNNYDEIKYQIKVEKEKDDTAVIIGTLTDKENRYARFKENKEAVVSDNGKTITVTTTKKKVTITVIVENAPYGTKINPKFNINSLDENNSKIEVDPVTITGKSVEGKVTDEKGTLYTGIELGLTSNGEPVKKTYTKSDGEYVFSLGELDTYDIKLEESKYKIVRLEEETVDSNKRVLNIVIKEVEPFELNIKKTISKLDLVINGSKETYEYDNVTKVVKSVKNAKTIEGSIYYNISIKNTGEIKGTLTALKDVVPEGLSFDASKNPGWTQEGKYLFYTILEGKEIGSFEKTSASLVLDIVKTNEAKNYINKAIVNGDNYKYVAYYLNNKIYKEEYVLSTEKISYINPEIENFDGWYTDREYTNKYNFDNTVTKDIVLFGKIKDNKYSVTFIDVNPNNNEETVLDVIEVDEGNSVELIENPTYKGYTFKCFELNDKCYEDEEIIEDTLLYASYSINNYEIIYELDGGTLEEDNPDTYTINDEFTLNNPTKTGFTFVGWSGTDLSEETLDLTIRKGSIGNREYIANFVINRSKLTVNPNGGTFLDSASSITYTEDYGTVLGILPSVRRGYTFKRYEKSGGGTYQNNIYTFDNEDGVLDAIYEINTYSISYANITEEELSELNNPVSFNVETESFTLREPSTRKDANGNNSEDFLGWDDGNGNVSINVEIPKGSIDNRTYTAVWGPNTDDYDIGYELDGGQLQPGQTNPTTYKRQTDTFTLYNPSKTGYDFIGWTGTELEDLTTIVTITQGSAGNRNYTAHYEVIPYTISYEGLTNAELEDLNNPTSYNIETNTFELNTPSTRKDIYGNNSEDFLGWDDGNGNVSINVEITKGSIGNRTYTAVWATNEDSYSITYSLHNGELAQGKTNPNTYKRQTPDFTLNNPSKAGYDFAGWTGTGLSAASTSVTITQGSAGNRTYEANYSVIPYTITYYGITNAERIALNNPTGYNVESNKITLNIPSTRKDNQGNNYEDFVGWDDGNGNVLLTTEIPTGSIGNRTYTAIWAENEDSYSITYSLHNGELAQGKTNPNTYKRQTPDFTLNNPSKAGYNFTGWTGTGLSAVSTSVTITQGSAGNRTYEANYSVIPYTISYVGLTDEELEDLENPTGYNVESNAIILSNPSRTGYTFTGWSGDGINDKSISVIIPTGSIGNRTYTANFEKSVYSISYTLDGGTVAVDNPESYSVESEDITLNNPTKAGYDFAGWTGTDLEETTTLVTIPTGSIGHRSYRANYTPIVYNITYDYAGGELEDGVTNPSTYTIESEDITFNAPVKEGYNFTHYTIGDTIITTIPQGSIGDKNLKANYEIKNYVVNYYNESVLHHTEEIDWNTKATKPLVDPTKPHHVFLYWSLDGVNEYDFDTLLQDSIDLYAVYEEVVSPEITISPSLNTLTNKTWVCGDSSNENCGVTVTLTSEHEEYQLYYKIGDEPAVLYTEPFKVYSNETITAFSMKNGVSSVTAESEIDNVDNIGPTINVPWTGAMSFNMTVSGTAQDAGSGVKKFTLYVKEKSALTFDSNYTYETTPDFDGIKDHAENYDHTFYDVNENTEYIVKIVAEDYVGNTSEREVEVITHPYVARVVGKNGILWYTPDPLTNEITPDGGREFLLFDSIQNAIDYCSNIQCTIQTNPTLPVVNESLTIGNNQNVVIDLDGRGIISSSNATIINNGKLQIVDRNTEKDNDDNYTKIGYIKNTDNKAIVNNGTLILGEGSSEATEIFIYPELNKPIIEGKQTALEQNNLFYFFDGKLVSDTLAITNNGEDPITQYSYNVVLTEDAQTEKKVATLEIVGDPEARIKSTYYKKLKVDLGLNAFDSSETGTTTQTSKKFLSEIKQAADYGFIYDAVTDSIVSGNTSSASTTALSYIKLDLTTAETDKFMVFDVFLDTNSTNSYGFVSVSETFGDTSNKIVSLSGNDLTGSKLYLLPKGKVYYIYFGFVKNRNNDSRYADINVNEIFRVSNFRLLGEREETSEFNLNNDLSYYPFVKQDDGSYASSNTGISNSYSHSYAVYDLSDQTEDMNYIVNVSVSSQSNNDFGYIYVSNTETLQGASNTNGRYVYISGDVQNKTYTIPLQAGQINYVHFCYYKNANTNTGSDKFTINSFILNRVKTEDIIIDSSLEHNNNDTYYFNDLYVWKDLTGNGNDGYVFGATLDNQNNGFVFNGSNNYINVGQINEPNFTWELEFKINNLKNSTILSNTETGGVSLEIKNNSQLVVNVYLSGGYRAYTLDENLETGKLYKVIVTYDGVEAKGYLDNTLIFTHAGTFKYPDSNTVILLGAEPSGGNATGNYFEGSIHNFKVYNRAISDEEITGTTSNTGLIVNLDGSNPGYQAEAYVSNNKNVNSSVAHSYLTYDLTNTNEDKYLFVRVSVSSQSNNDIGYVQVTDSTAVPSNSYGRELSISGTVNDQSAVFRLTKNKVNYVHFVYTKNANTHNGADIFIIKDIKYCNSIDDAYSVSPTNYKTENYAYFETPILNQKVDTIEILKPITLTSSIVVPKEKAVILDLNGFTLTSDKDGYVIKNNGDLKIIDSDFKDRQNQNQNYKLLQAELYEAAKTKYLEDLAEYEEYAGLGDNEEPSYEYKYDHLSAYLDYFGFDSESLHQKDYDYTGTSDEYNVTESGTYVIEVWGAQGETMYASAPGGAGSYVSGKIDLIEGETLYVYVGGIGSEFNGGGRRAHSYANGSGASDVRLTSGSWSDATSLASRIIVAGSGAGGFNRLGGAGGALKGIDGTNGSYGNHGGKGGTQISGGARGTGGFENGTAGSFGRGGNGVRYSSGGGSGYYGGGSSGVDTNEGGGGGGGSSYISGHQGCVAIKDYNDFSARLDSSNETQCTEESALQDITCSYHYSDRIFTETVMKSGLEEMPTFDASSVMIGNSNNGHVKIAKAISDEDIEEIYNQIPKKYNVKTMPVFKDYIEEIDIDASSVDLENITVDDEVSYNDIASTELNGKIVSTVDNIILNEEGAKLNLDSGIINVNVNSKIGITNRGTLIVGKNGIINANNSSSIGIYNETNGDIFSFDGTINAVGSSSIGLLNRSNDETISNVGVVTTPSNAVGIYNESVTDVTFNNINVEGAGIAFSDRYTSGNTIINNSNLKSTGNSSLYVGPQLNRTKLIVSTSNLYGQVAVRSTPKNVMLNNSSLTSIYNAFGYVSVNSSALNYIDNRGETIVNNSTLNGSGLLITNYASSGDRGNTEHIGKLLLRNSIVNSTATGSTTLINNHYFMTIDSTTFNNINGVKSTVINNTYNYNPATPYLNITGDTTIAQSFGTAIYNTGVLTVGTNDNNVKSEYDYVYTGEEEVFTAPETGTYKLETWGAAGSETGGWSYGYVSIFRGGFGGYASGTISLQEGEKLYIHVGGAGATGSEPNGIKGFSGSYNGGGRLSGNVGDRIVSGAGGGATDIALTSEDNTWYYDSGITYSRRSDESYLQRILVAGGGGNCYSTTNCYGGYGVTASTGNGLGIGGIASGGGYYGGVSGTGGSSYASSILSDVVMINGNQEMPDYVSGLTKGNLGNGHAKITLISSEEGKKVKSTPTIASTNTGITGTGRFMYYDGTITANTAIDAAIEDVPEGYDIYKSAGNGVNEKYILLDNNVSRPVAEGQEVYVAAIGNAKFTTIQNAVNYANNGDEIDLLVDIVQQNTITIPQNKQVTIDYNGHIVTSYSSETLINNTGNLTLKDSTNSLRKNIYYGKNYIVNSGIMSMDKIYIGNTGYSINMIDNTGNLTITNSKIDFTGVSGRTAILNAANGTMNLSSNTLYLAGNNSLISNSGALTSTSNTFSESSAGTLIWNNSTGTITIDANTYSVSGDDRNGRSFLRNAGTATVTNITTSLTVMHNTGKMTLSSNTLPSFTINNSETGLLIIENGTYNNTFNIGGTGRTNDATNNLYSFIMRDGTINSRVNISSTGISNIEGGTINVTSGYAIYNTGAGTINLGIKDQEVAPKQTTKPVITGQTYGIYTSVPGLIVNFYDGIITGEKAYNVTIGETEVGYSVHIDNVDNKEIKYLTDEPIFKNITRNVEYKSVSEFNTAIADELVQNDDVIQVLRDITITSFEDQIIIPNGLKITFDLNDYTIDKNNTTLFVINGELDVINSNNSLNEELGVINANVGKIFENNGTLKIYSGNYVSQKNTAATSLILNNTGGDLTISGGSFTKYYDNILWTQSNSGEVIRNNGTTTITGGKFYSNASYVEAFHYRFTSNKNYLRSSAIFTNTATGNLTVTGGTFDGVSSSNWVDRDSTYRSTAGSVKGEIIYNSGTASISNVISGNSHIGVNSGTLTLDHVNMTNIVDINSTMHPNLINSGSLIISNSFFTLHTAFADNRGSMDITNTTIDKVNNGSAYRSDGDSEGTYKNSHVIRSYVNGNNYINVVNSYIYNRGSGEVFDNRVRLSISGSTVQAENSSTIYSYSTTTDIIKNSTISSTNARAIYVNNGTLNIGESIEEDGTVSQTNPVLQGNTYGVYNNSNSTTINFYDGIIMGKTSPVQGIITNTEVGYTPMTGTQGEYTTNYLDRVEVIKNVTQSTSNNEVKYYDLKTAFEEANNGDTLQMIENYNNLTIDLPAVVDTNVTLDLNGYTIRQSNNQLFTVNSKLTIVDTGTGGQIIALSGTSTFDNYGIIELNGGTITTTHGILLFNNRSGATLTIQDGGVVNSTSASLLIDNSGTVNIYNGAYLHNVVDLSGHLIINRNILNIIDFNNDDDPNTTSEYDAPWIYSEGSENGNTDNIGYYNNAPIRTYSGAVTTIYGGKYNNGKTYQNGSPDKTKMIYNSGTTNIKNLDSYSYNLGYNNGTLNIEDSNFHNFDTLAIYSSGTLNIRNTDFVITQQYTTSYLGNFRIYSNRTDLDNVTVTGYSNNEVYTGSFIEIYGLSSITDSDINLKTSSETIKNNNTVNISNTVININNSVYNGGTMELDDTDITSSSVAINNTGNLTLENNTTVTSTSNNAITTSGTLNVKIGADIISQNGAGIYLSGNGVLNVGEIGGTVDNESPYIEGTTFGINKDSQSSSLNFYDGLIVGRTGPNAIRGGVTSIEGNHETENVIETDQSTNTDIYKEYLVVSATSVAVANVGTYTFTTSETVKPSKALQNAIDFAIGDGSNIRDVDLVTRVDLVSDEINITASEPVTINLNGFEIVQDSNYKLSSNITLNSGSNVGASISKVLSDVFDVSNNPKDILIYEMSDGSKLDTSKIYKLYKDDKVLGLEKEELGKYRFKGDTIKLTPIKGRLYIDNLYKGSYRLVSSDNKYLEFSIDEHGNISGNVTVNNRNSNNIETISNSEAELILTIQTGVKKHYYLLFIIPITICILLLIIFNKRKHKNA